MTTTKQQRQMSPPATMESLSFHIVDNINPHIVRNLRGPLALHHPVTNGRRDTLPTKPSRMTKNVLCGCLLLSSGLVVIDAFVPPPLPRPVAVVAVALAGPPDVRPRPRSRHQQQQPQRPSSTSLHVWWFGGTPGASTETSDSGEECELVAVRIDKTSSNSRRIAGEIVVPVPLDDVWAILTDYDDLARHVPNLVASRRLSDRGGHPGDGNHRCRLYQRGAQKIVGFEFGADVTMDMTERIVVAGGGMKSGVVGSSSSSSGAAGLFFPEERRIDFKCVDSQFFSEFDGTWRVVEMPDNPFTGESETTVSYTVEVRPKGPVPVAALEWRIREVSLYFDFVLCLIFRRGKAVFCSSLHTCPPPPPHTHTLDRRVTPSCDDPRTCLPI